MLYIPNRTVSFRSSGVNSYIIVAYQYDEHEILVEPLKNRQAEIITEGWKRFEKKTPQPGYNHIHT